MNEVQPVGRSGFTLNLVKPQVCVSSFLIVKVRINVLSGGPVTELGEDVTIGLFLTHPCA